MEEQQQQPSNTHQRVLEGIERLSDPNLLLREEERHILSVHGYGEVAIDRNSLQHLVEFLNGDSHEVEITRLGFYSVRLSYPSDEGLDVLRSFFAQSDTTLTKVTLQWCDFGGTHEASQLLSTFETNRTVSDLTIRHTVNLEGAALGACLSGLLQNMPQLQRLDCSKLLVEGVRALQPALQANRTLRELNLYFNHIGDDGILLIADALVGNTTIEVLNIIGNDITSNSLDDITRLLESTRLTKIYFGCNPGLFNDEASTQRFARMLTRHRVLKKLSLGSCRLGDGGIRIIADGLVGNTIMEALDISSNLITSNGLPDIRRLIELTQLKSISLLGNRGVFNDTDAQPFVTTLQHKNSSVEELPGIIDYLPVNIRAAAHASIQNSLTRNRQLNRVNLLLAPPPPQQQQHQQQRNAASMMLKTWHKAITKFAMVPNNAGASAIFKLFQARPALLEKRLKRPSAPATTTGSSNNAGNDNKRGDDVGGGGGTDITSLSGQKRRRL